MASGKSNYLRNAILDHILGVAPYTAPTKVYLALSTSGWSPSVTGTTLTSTEPSGGGYARVELDNDDTMWSEAAGGSSTSLVTVEFGTASSSWGTINSFYIVDAASGGNTLWGGDLYTPRSITSGDSSNFPEGQLNISEV